MPSGNCSIYGFSALRRYTGVAFFKVPKKRMILQRNGLQN